MILPNLFIPGAAKSGTSSLHMYLAQHPDIFMCRAKEPSFFSRDDKYRDGIDAYARLFAEAGDTPVRGESSTGYMIFDRAAERIHRHIESPRFIFLLRNPIDRAYSHYNWLVSLGEESRDFRTAFLADMSQTPDPASHQLGNYRYYFRAGCYGSSVERFAKTFGRRSFHTITSEALMADPQSVLDSCFRFLNLPLALIDTRVRANVTTLARFPGLRGHFRHLINGSIASRVGTFLRTMGLGAWALAGHTTLERKIDLLLSSSTPPPPMDEDTRRWVARYYEEEIGILEDLTKLRPRQWQADFGASPNAEMFPAADVEGFE